MDGFKDEVSKVDRDPSLNSGLVGWTERGGRG